MQYPEHALVVLASTLAGGMDRNRTLSPGNATCGRGTAWLECEVLDESIAPLDVALPWVFTLGTLVFLGMPTLVLRSKHKERGLGRLAWDLLQCLALMLCSSFVTDHPSICFALTTHSCARLLTRMEGSKALVGGAWWWGLRYLALAQLLAWLILAGPAISVVRWESTPPALPCAYLAHLAGCVVPDLILFILFALRAAGKSVCARDD
jgi:hypothetical protein